MMPVHHFRVSPCVIIVKYGKCAANLMVSLCIHLELADVIANVGTLKYESFHAKRTNLRTFPHSTVSDLAEKNSRSFIHFLIGIVPNISSLLPIVLSQKDVLGVRGCSTLCCSIFEGDRKSTRLNL